MKNKLLTTLLFLVIAQAFIYAIPAKSTAACYHFNKTYTYTKIDDTSHRCVGVCKDCGYEEITIKEHNLSYATRTYTSYDEEYHYYTRNCNDCGATIHLYEKHDLKSLDAKYSNSDLTYHYVQAQCWDCKQTITRKEEHSVKYTTPKYSPCDSTYHYKEGTCSKCDAPAHQKYTHNLSSSPSSYIPDNDNDHKHNSIYKCIDCNANVAKKEGHSFCSWDEKYSDIDSTYHYFEYKCRYCNTHFKEKEKHSFSDSSFTYSPCDSTYHYRVSTCYGCGRTKKVKQEHHFFTFPDVIKKATPISKGTMRYDCTICNNDVYKTISWSRYGDGCVDNAFNHEPISRSTTKLKIHLKFPLKGAVIKAKIGKKSYRKKITNNSKEIKIHIGHHHYGEKYSIKIYYNGKKIVYDDCTHIHRVLYTLYMRKGLTKKQASYTSWGFPYKTTNTYWRWGHGHIAYFKNGRVTHWRKVY